MISELEYVLINSLANEIVDGYGNVCFHRSKFTNHNRVEIDLVDSADDVCRFEETVEFLLSDLDMVLPTGFVFRHMLFYPDGLFREVSCNIVVTKNV